MQNFCEDNDKLTILGAFIAKNCLFNSTIYYKFRQLIYNKKRAKLFIGIQVCYMTVYFSAIFGCFLFIIAISI